MGNIAFWVFLAGVVIINVLFIHLQWTQYNFRKWVEQERKKSERRLASYQNQINGLIVLLEIDQLAVELEERAEVARSGDREDIAQILLFCSSNLKDIVEDTYGTEPKKN